MPAKKHILIGIAGGSGSGKTLFSERLAATFRRRPVDVVTMDSYYRPLSHLELEARAEVDFDHPNALDIEMIQKHVRDLAAGRAIEVPVYDFSIHDRLPRTRRVDRPTIVIFEGILAFWFADIRSTMDIKIFVDTPADVRLARRVRRDVRERGRDVEDVLNQYERFVRPAHEQFVEPTKQHADVIVPRGGNNNVALDLVRSKIDELLRGPAEADATEAS